jgi:hypothetical protein
MRPRGSALACSYTYAHRGRGAVEGFIYLHSPGLALDQPQMATKCNRTNVSHLPYNVHKTHPCRSCRTLALVTCNQLHVRTVPETSRPASPVARAASTTQATSFRRAGMPWYLPDRSVVSPPSAQCQLQPSPMLRVLPLSGGCMMGIKGAKTMEMLICTKI